MDRKWRLYSFLLGRSTGRSVCYIWRRDMEDPRPPSLPLIQGIRSMHSAVRTCVALRVSSVRNIQYISLRAHTPPPPLPKATTIYLLLLMTRPVSLHRSTISTPPLPPSAPPVLPPSSQAPCSSNLVKLSILFSISHFPFVVFQQARVRSASCHPKRKRNKLRAGGPV